ncbi:hypothetical protein SAMN00120144_3074 [Hymenobacter roseosalivarius DSM 11622]|uniref:Uncharacterized protein n=2 Tax=Hymenobacter roseosalivarius TaxID=89967 RepID=A0A1W1W6H4_9BACT|nr:hypothetical protein SAMN00120144_3074 [Hymenobacter roseosalivarius DSM 11622]
MDLVVVRIDLGLRRLLLTCAEGRRELVKMDTRWVSPRTEFISIKIL